MKAEKRQELILQAEKLFSRGKLEGALSRYRKILKAHPNDTSTLKRVGDVFERLNRVDEAITLYKKTAQHFTNEGFYAKAIAIYKKIIRLDPTLIEAIENLADLQHRQGLTREAVSQYEVVADYYLKLRDLNSVIEIHKKMVELEPGDPSRRLKLAEFHQKRGRLQDALEQYRAISRMMLSSGRIGEASRVCLRALEIDPTDLNFVAGAVEDLKSAGHPEEAERLILAAIDLNPEAKNLQAQMSEATAAVEEEAEDFDLESFMAGAAPEVSDTGPLPESEVSDTGPLPEPEAEAAVAIEDAEQEEATTAAMEVQPAEVGVEDAGAVMSPDEVEKLAEAEAATATPSEEVEIEIDLGDLEEEEPIAAPPPVAAEPAPPTAVPEPDVEIALTDLEEPDAVIEPVKRFDMEEPSPPAEAAEPSAPAEAPEPPPAEALEPTPAGETLEPSRPFQITEPSPPAETLEPSRPFQITEPSPPVETPEPATQVASSLPLKKAVPIVEAEPEPGERLSELLTEADVLSRYGLEDKAVEKLEELLAEEADNLEAMGRLITLKLEAKDLDRVAEIANQLVTVAQERDEPEAWQRVREQILGEGFTVEDGQVVPPVEEVAMEAEEETLVIAEDVDLGDADLSWLEEEPAAGEDQAPPAEALFEAEEEFFDLASELEEELRQEEAIDDDEFLLSGEEESIEDIVAGFKKGMAETLSDEDFDTHYNLGIAYREMGLIDEAIGEFQLAAKDPRYLVECCSLLALCFKEKGFPELAIKWYQRGLDSPTISEDETLGLVYELGDLYLELGNTEAARERFVEIYGVNSTYRDVVAKLQELGGS